MKFLILFLFTFCSIISYTQKDKNEYFLYDNNWKGVKEVFLSKYMVVVEKIKDTLYQVYYYNTYSSLFKFESFKDRTAKIKNGYFIWYDNNGQMDSSVVFLNNEKQVGINNTNKVKEKSNFQLKNKNSSTYKKDSTEFKSLEIECSFKDWNKHLIKNLTYPEQSIKLKNQGYCEIQFMVDKLGLILNTYISKSIDYFIDKESLRVVKLSSGKWTPAFQNGVFVQSYHQQGIKFVLPN